MQEYILTRKQLSTTSLYNYCPYCVRQFRETNHDNAKTYKDTLQPVIYTKILQVGKDKNGDDQKYIEEFWLCPKCKSHLDDKDYVKMYCLRPDGTKYTEKPLTEKKYEITK